MTEDKKNPERIALMYFYERNLVKLDEVPDRNALRKKTYKQLETTILEHLAELYYQVNTGGSVLKRVTKQSKINKN